MAKVRGRAATKEDFNGRKKDSARKENRQPKVQKAKPEHAITVGKQAITPKIVGHQNEPR